MQYTYGKPYLLFRYIFNKLSAHINTIENGSNHDNDNNINKKFWEELIVYFPFTTY
jgi:hypothetical protein